MYSIYTAIAVALIIALVPLAFGVSAAWTVLPGFLVGVFTFVFINRRMSKRVEAVTQAADREMANMQRIAQRGPQAEAAVMQCIAKSVEILEKGFGFAKWQLGISTMLNARIGMLLYTRWILSQQFTAIGGRKKGKGKGASPNVGLAEAIPYLEKSRIKGRKAQLLSAMWPAWAMLAVAYYKSKKDIDKAVEVLEDTTKIAKKNGILWSLYAWMLTQEKRRDEAIDVLVRGKDAAPDDPHLVENLTLLQNNKSMKMRAYGEQWYQFGLEKPRGVAAAQQQKIGHPRSRGRRR